MALEPRSEREAVLVVEPRTEWWDEVAAAVDTVVRLVGGTLHDVRERLAAGPGVVVFGPTFGDETHLLEVEALDLQRHGVLGVLVADGVGEQLLHRALAAGLREVVAQDDAGLLLPIALERLFAHLDLDGGGHVASPGRILAFTGAKAGVGTSTLAVNVAVELASNGRRVLLVDADTQFGDQSLLLGLRPSTGLTGVVGQEGRMTPRRLRNLLTEHGPTGVQLLAAPRGPEEASGVGARELVAVLEAAVQLADVVVVDTAAGLGELTLAVLDEADAIVLVTVPAATALHDLGRELGVLDRLHLRAKTQLVVNRAVPERTPSRHRLEAGAGIPLAGCVPECADVAGAESLGRPIVTQRRNRAAAAVRSLAAELVAPAVVH